MEQALQQLKPDDIVVLTLRHYLDLQLEDVAAAPRLPVPTVNSRLRSARARLREQLERQSPDQVYPMNEHELDLALAPSC